MRDLTIDSGWAILGSLISTLEITDEADGGVGAISYCQYTQVTALCRSAIFIRADTTSAADVAEMVEQTMSRFGRLDAAFNNVGTPGRFTDVIDCSEEEWV